MSSNHFNSNTENAAPEIGEKLALVINNSRQLTQNLSIYQLKMTDGNDLPLVAAGTSITLTQPIAPTVTNINTTHFICSNPLQRNHYEIIQQTNEVIFTGNVLGTLTSNSFPLHADSSPAIFIAEGVGIAPILAMAYTLSARGRRFNLHYVSIDKISTTFIDELQHHFARQLIVYSETENTSFDMMHLLADAPTHTQFYISGSQSLVANAESCVRALGIAKDRMQYNCTDSIEDNRDKPLIIELAYANKLIQVNAEESLLSAVRAAGINVSFDCCIGECGSCATKVLEGEPEHRDHVLSDSDKQAGLMCLCVSRAHGEKLVLAL